MENDLIRRSDVLKKTAWLETDVPTRAAPLRTEIILADDVRSIPAVDAVEVRHGRWRQNDNGTWSCSECSSWIPDEQHYYARFCLHCGARMGGKEAHNAAD